MKEYPKIQSLFKRDPATNNKRFIVGDYSLPEFEYLKNNEWRFTEKVDGTNIRIMIGEGAIRFGGKTDSAQISAKLIQALSEHFFPRKLALFEAFPDGVCFYGEGYGAGIQSGGNYRPDQNFVLFDVKVGDWWLQHDAVHEISNKFDMETVPVIGYGTLGDMIERTSKGFTSVWGSGHAAEGIVARPTTELKTRSGERVITKLKHKDFK